jgi:hypothetical protein
MERDPTEKDLANPEAEPSPREHLENLLTEVETGTVIEKIIESAEDEIAGYRNGISLTSEYVRSERGYDTPKLEERVKQADAKLMKLWDHIQSLRASLRKEG